VTYAAHLKMSPSTLLLLLHQYSVPHLLALLGEEAAWAGGMEDVLRRILQSFESLSPAILGIFEPLHLLSSVQLPSSMFYQTSINIALTNLYL